MVSKRYEMLADILSLLNTAEAASQQLCEHRLTRAISEAYYIAADELMKEQALREADSWQTFENTSKGTDL